MKVLPAASRVGESERDAALDREILKEPVYDVKTLDRLVTGVARDIRLLEQALKATNAKTVVEGYTQDDAVLGELS